MYLLAKLRFFGHSSKTVRATRKLATPILTRTTSLIHWSKSDQSQISRFGRRGSNVVSVFLCHRSTFDQPGAHSFRDIKLKLGRLIKHDVSYGLLKKILGSGVQWGPTPPKPFFDIFYLLQAITTKFGGHLDLIVRDAGKMKFWGSDP